MFLFSDFSNVISKSDVKTLAEADAQEVVREVQVSISGVWLSFLGAFIAEINCQVLYMSQISSPLNESFLRKNRCTR